MPTVEWEQADLARRLVRTIRLAVELVSSRPDLGVDRRDQRRSTDSLPVTKVVDEACMLLFAAAQVRELDPAIDAAVRVLADRLRPYARTETVLAGLLLDPVRARDHATVHLILTALGHRDPDLDDLLRRSVADGAQSAPERLPHRELEQRWLARLGPDGGLAGAQGGPEADLVRCSSLGRPLNPLHASPLDLYAFTHAVLYASDFGIRSVALPRAAADLSADAEAALAGCLDLDDLDLAAELLWTWPMLGLNWTPGATFAWSVLAASADRHGYLPGPDFHPDVYARLSTDTRLGPGRARRYRQTTCYHTTFVFGFLCAAALRTGRTPPATPPSAAGPGAAADLVALIERVAERPARPRWVIQWLDLTAEQRHGLTDFVLAAALARARNRGDLELTRACLQIASRADALQAPAPRQALALLGRAASYQAPPKTVPLAVSTRG